MMKYETLIRRRSELMREINMLRARHRRRKIYFISLQRLTTEMLKQETTWLRVARPLNQRVRRRNAKQANQDVRFA